MHARVLALLLAVSMALCVVGISAPTVLASSDMVGLVDDGPPDAHPMITETPIAVPPARRGELAPVVALLAVPDGRVHEECVFRPPRAIASR